MWSAAAATACSFEGKSREGSYYESASPCDRGATSRTHAVTVSRGSAPTERQNGDVRRVGKPHDTAPRLGCMRSACRRHRHVHQSFPNPCCCVVDAIEGVTTSTGALEGSAGIFLVPSTARLSSAAPPLTLTPYLGSLWRMHLAGCDLCVRAGEENVVRDETSLPSNETTLLKESLRDDVRQNSPSAPSRRRREEARFEDWVGDRK